MNLGRSVSIQITGEYENGRRQQRREHSLSQQMTAVF